MIIETKTPQETFEVGKKIGENAKPGQIYTLTGDLGVGKTVFTRELRQGLGSQSLSAARHLRSFRNTKADVFLYIILMFTVSVTLRKWKKSDMTIILRTGNLSDRMG